MNMKNKISQQPKQTKELKVLLTFLKRTKEGKYAAIEKSSFPYSRLNEQPETVVIEEQYNYGLS
jgi:hypothetical protein